MSRVGERRKKIRKCRSLANNEHSGRLAIWACGDVDCEGSDCGNCGGFVALAFARVWCAFQAVDIGTDRAWKTALLNVVTCLVYFRVKRLSFF